MPDSSNVSPEAEDLARVLNAAVRPRWMHSTQEFWLTPAQAAIDAGWTPPPDPHEDIAREIRDEAFPADAGTPFPGDRVEMRILAAVRRMDLRRGDQIGPTTQQVNEGDPSTWPDITATEALIAAAYAWVDRITDPPFQWADDEDLAVIAAVRAHRGPVETRGHDMEVHR